MTGSVIDLGRSRDEPEENSFTGWKDRIAWGMLAGTVAITVMWAAWITNEVFAKTNGPTVEKMIQQYSPYVKDRALVVQTMDDVRASSREMRTSVENNTKAVIQLQEVVKLLLDERKK